MKVDVVIEGHKCFLVAYRKHHVEKYHNWMKSPELLEQTASEPLTLEKEFEMQKSWEEDEDKLTFIILLKAPEIASTAEVNSSESFAKYMVGDVNLFFNDQDDKSAAEVEIMIAEKKSRRGGIGLEAVSLIMRYAYDKLGIRKYVAKIGESNSASNSMFTNKLGFKQVSHCQVFKEITYELLVQEMDKLPKVNKYVLRSDSSR